MREVSLSEKHGHISWYVNPMSFEPTLRVTINPEVSEWLKANCQGVYDIVNTDNRPFMWFEMEEDAISFALAW